MPQSRLICDQNSAGGGAGVVQTARQYRKGLYHFHKDTLIGYHQTIAGSPLPTMPNKARLAVTGGQASQSNMNNPAQNMSALLARLDNWLKQQRPHYLKGLNSGATSAQLEALAAELGRTPPEDLRSLLAWHNGQSNDFFGAFEGSWKLMSTEQIAEAVKLLRLTRGEAGAARGVAWETDWIPFLDDDAGHYVFVASDRPGAPVLEGGFGYETAHVVAPSLVAWMHEYVRALEAGRYFEDPERGEMLREER